MNFYAINVAPFVGSETHLATGAGAVVVHGEGAALQAKRGVAQASIAISMQGQGWAVYLLAGESQMALTAIGSAIKGILGESDAEIRFGGQYSIPDTIPVPTAYYPAKQTIRLSSDQRTIRVPFDPRLQPERNQA